MLPRIRDNKGSLAAKDKFNNATSTAISELLLDVDSIRYAMLQNRTATDFLLSAHRHGCQDFKGLYCMNLSDHSKSIHAQLQELLRPNQQLVETTFENLFAGWTWGWGWLKQILLIACVEGICLLCLVCCLLFLISIIRSAVDAALHRTLVRVVEYVALKTMCVSMRT